MFFDAPFACCNFGADALFLVVLAAAFTVDFAAEATRLDFACAALAFAGADLRLETLAVFAAFAAAFFTGRADLLIFAETFASLALLVALDFGDRLMAFAGWADDFFVAFFRVDMADLLLKPSASSLR